MNLWLMVDTGSLGAYNTATLQTEVMIMFKGDRLWLRQTATASKTIVLSPFSLFSSHCFWRARAYRYPYPYSA